MALNREADPMETDLIIDFTRLFSTVWFCTWRFFL